MPRYNKYDYSRSCLLPFDCNEQIIHGMLEYTIHYVIENIIDTSQIEKRFRNEETGTPSYYPRIILKIVFMAYTRGVVSSRKID